MCAQSIIVYKVIAVCTFRPSHHRDIKAKVSHNFFILPENKVYKWKWNQQPPCFVSSFGVKHNLLRYTSKVSDIMKLDIYIYKGPITGPRCPEGSRKLRFPDYVTVAQDGGKVVSLKHRPLLPPGNTHFCQRLSRHQDHNAIGRIMSKKNSNDTI